MKIKKFKHDIFVISETKINSNELITNQDLNIISWFKFDSGNWFKPKDASKLYDQIFTVKTEESLINLFKHYEESAINDGSPRVREIDLD